FACTINFSRERPSFLNGEHSKKGRLAFFPYCLLVKTPPGFLALLGLALVALATRDRSIGKRRWRLYEILPLLIFLADYWAFAIASNLNIGHRHLLPTYPAMYILAGGVTLWLRQREPESHSAGRPDWRAATAIGLCLVSVIG